jgi:uncharacterized protein (DUF58 family)
VGLLAQGAQGAEPILVAPSRRADQLQRLLRALAGARASSDEPLARLLQRHGARIRSGAHCVIVTPAVDTAWALALPQLIDRSVHVTALLLDSAPLGGAGDPREAAGRLAELGVASRIIGAEIYARLNPRPAPARGAAPGNTSGPRPAPAPAWEWTSPIGERPT